MSTPTPEPEKKWWTKKKRASDRAAAVPAVLVLVLPPVSASAVGAGGLAGVEASAAASRSTSFYLPSTKPEDNKHGKKVKNDVHRIPSLVSSRVVIERGHIQPETPAAGIPVSASASGPPPPPRRLEAARGEGTVRKLDKQSERLPSHRKMSFGPPPGRPTSGRPARLDVYSSEFFIGGRPGSSRLRTGRQVRAHHPDNLPSSPLPLLPSDPHPSLSRVRFANPKTFPVQFIVLQSKHMSESRSAYGPKSLEPTPRKGESIHPFCTSPRLHVCCCMSIVARVEVQHGASVEPEPFTCP